MYSLVGKVAILVAMTVGTYFMGDSIFAPMGGAGGGCPFRDATSCCIYYCRHDSSTGCNGSSSCCANLCR